MRSKPSDSLIEEIHAEEERSPSPGQAEEAGEVVQGGGVLRQPGAALSGPLCIGGA